MAAALWAGGFLRMDELQVLERLRRPKGAPAPDVAPPETTEFAGEIVATDLPDQELPPAGRRGAPEAGR